MIEGELRYDAVPLDHLPDVAVRVKGRYRLGVQVRRVISVLRDDARVIHRREVVIHVNGRDRLDVASGMRPKALHCPQPPTPLFHPTSPREQKWNYHSLYFPRLLTSPFAFREQLFHNTL